MICINIEFPTLGTKIQRPQAGIKGLGFFNGLNLNLCDLLRFLSKDFMFLDYMIFAP